MVVAHSNILSLFNVIEQKWIQHIPMEDQVYEIFRQKNAAGGFELVVIMNNGTMRFLKSSSHGGGDHMEIDPSLEYKIPGTIVHFASDKEESQWAFVLVKLENGDFQFWCMHHRKAFLISDQFPAISDKSSFTFMYAPGDVSQFIY